MNDRLQTAAFASTVIGISASFFALGFALRGIVDGQGTAHSSGDSSAGIRATRPVSTDDDLRHLLDHLQRIDEQAGACSTAAADPCDCVTMLDTHPFFDLSLQERSAILERCPL